MAGISVRGCIYLSVYMLSAILVYYFVVNNDNIITIQRGTERRSIYCRPYCVFRSDLEEDTEFANLGLWGSNRKRQVSFCNDSGC